MNPSKIEFEVGKTRFNQRITLTRESAPSVAPSWTLRKFAAGQRDDESIIFGLDDATILRMAEAVATMKKVGGE